MKFPFAVNGEYITACNHDDAVNILRNAGDIVVLTVKHYRAAKPFLQKTGSYNIYFFKVDSKCVNFCHKIWKSPLSSKQF